MRRVLTNQSEREESRRLLCALLESRAEWFCTETGRRGAGLRESRSVVLGRDDWELRATGAALHFSCWTESGARAWRVEGWREAGGKLLVDVTRRAGAERATLELVPRASVQEALAEAKDARAAACERLARAACALVPGAEVESVRLSAGARRSEPGRYARVLLRLRGARERVAVTGPIVEVRPHEADAVLASALMWWSRLGAGAGARRKQAAPSRLWLVCARELAGPLGERVALLRGDVRRAISLFERGEEGAGLTPREAPALEALLSTPGRLRVPPPAEPGETAARLVALAPDLIDVVRARRGETVRFRGLPFARVRRLPSGERVWFGAPGAGQKVLLDEGNWPRLAKLIDELAEHRRADPPDPRHAFHRAAPESWLESILRRDITRLDPGLVVSPLHLQFRTSRAGAGTGSRPVDLLALRRDGRLVVIELKVSEDAALPLQGADYWRRVEAHRRGGELARARLFGDHAIADEPPLVYLVAPMLRFHRAFETLARCVTSEIEMYRFDLNEDWRAGVRVARRGRVV